MQTQTVRSHAATTAKCRGNALHKCRGCGHRVGKGQQQTTVRWWDTRYRTQQLRVDRYHAECAPPFDASRVVLLKPGYEWDWLVDTRYRLVPSRPDMVVDTTSGLLIEDANRRAHGSGFMAVARATNSNSTNSTPPSGWQVTTRGCGAGSTRHEWYPTLEQAQQHLVQWYLRRYKFADERLPQ